MLITDPTAAGLLRAILHEPDSDELRLVYADWLEEHGPPARAEFIRCQIELARQGHIHSHEQVEHEKALRRRERALLEAWSKDAEGEPMHYGDRMHEWFGDAIRRVGRSNIIVHRGFVEVIACDLATLFGGLCGRCEGRGYYYPMNPIQQRGCPVCHGTGRTEGVAAAVFGQHPIVEVRVLNCNRCGGSKRITVTDEEELRRWNDAGILAMFPPRKSIVCPVCDSDTLVNLGRARAGLPPLPGRDAP